MVLDTGKQDKQERETGAKSTVKYMQIDEFI